MFDREPCDYHSFLIGSLAVTCFSSRATLRLYYYLQSFTLLSLEQQWPLPIITTTLLGPTKRKTKKNITNSSERACENKDSLLSWHSLQIIEEMCRFFQYEKRDHKSECVCCLAGLSLSDCRFDFTIIMLAWERLACIIIDNILDSHIAYDQQLGVVYFHLYNTY